MVCRQLGFQGAIKFTTRSAFGTVPTLFAFDNVRCNGNETSLNDCPHLNTDDCSLEEGAGVVCGAETGPYIPPTNPVSSNNNYTGKTMNRYFSVNFFYNKG